MIPRRAASAIAQYHQISGGEVPHLDRAAIQMLIEAVGALARSQREGERNRLMVALLFDGALRVTEVVGRSQLEADQLKREVTARLKKKRGRPRTIEYGTRPGVRLMDINDDNDSWCVTVAGKGGKVQPVAISASLGLRLVNYALKNHLEQQDRLFPLTRSRVAQIMRMAFKATGIQKPEHVGTVHILRHSGAIERLALTKNPKAVQDHLRHSDPKMTLLYMKTLAKKESLRIQQEVDFGW